MDDRKNEKVSEILLVSLRLALADTGEHRLYKSGKLEGLFAGRTGAAGDAAAEAMREGLLEAVRTDVKGKISTEWVRLTPKGVDYIYHHDSARAVLEEMRGLMNDARSGVPNWLNETLGELQTMSRTFGNEMQRYLQRLDALTQRVEEALRRVDAGMPPLTEPMQGLVPWGLDALTYLDRRKQSGATEPCPLPELFAAVRQTNSHLSIPDFQKGLKRLADNRAVTLLPYVGMGHIPAPEYAIPEGGHMLYLASR